MNLVYNIVGRLTGSRAHEELEHHLQGQAHILRPPGVKSSKELIYDSAILSVRRTAHAFEAQLLLTRIFDEDVVDPDEEELDAQEMACLIDERINFSSHPSTQEESPSARSVSLSWRTSDDEVWLFVTDPEETSAQDVSMFERQVRRCCFERKYRQTADEASEEQLDEFKVHPDDTPASLRYRGILTATASDHGQSDTPLFREESPASTIVEELDDEDQLAARVNDLSVEDAAGDSIYGNESRPLHPVALTSQSPLKGGMNVPEASSDREVAAIAQRQQIVSETIDVHLFDDATRTFPVQEKGARATIWHVEGQNCWLTVVRSDNTPCVSLFIDEKGITSFDSPQMSITFDFPNEDQSKHYTWLLRAHSKDVFDRLRTAFTLAIHEAKMGAGTWARLKDDEQAFQRDSRMTGVRMSDDDTEYEDDEEAEDGEDARLGYSEEEAADVESDENVSDSDVAHAIQGAKKNSSLAVGYKNDLSFVVRGDMIGVFQSRANGGKRLKFNTNIQGLKTPNGKGSLEPDKVMLHDQDSSMVIRDPKDPSSLYRLDLETGRVVDRWQLGEHIDVKTFLPDSKFAQTTHQQTFIGASHNSLFRIDPRERGFKVVQSQTKDYASKMDFSAAATTENGRLVVGSGNGQLRFYDALGKIAKTALPATGDRIIGVDTTKDGRYIVATTARYLYLIDAQIQDGKHKGQLGFDRSFPKANQPTFRVLQLQPQHRQYIGEISFTPAKINSGLNSKEKTIVSSTGPFVIAWNLRRAISGQTDSYSIVRVAEQIVADGFRFGDDKDIIVVQPSDVGVKHKTELLRPTRESLSLPTPRRSNIVRTYE